MQPATLEFFLDPPEQIHTGVLEVTALAPLSMVTSQPGTYFRSELKPPEQMVYGMLENALGWHFDSAERKTAMRQLAKKAKKLHHKNDNYADHPWLSGKPEQSAKSGFFSLLQYHLHLGISSEPEDVLTYDDLWSMHLRDRGMNFVGGSRSYDYRLEELITKLRSTAHRAKNDKNFNKDDKYDVGDRKEYKRIDLEDLYQTEETKIHSSSLGDAYPMYYVSPKTRGFVVAKEAYRIPFSCTPTVRQLLQRAVDHPLAPTYLGTSEGWVHLSIIDDHV